MNTYELRKRLLKAYKNGDMNSLDDYDVLDMLTVLARASDEGDGGEDIPTTARKTGHEIADTKVWVPEGLRIDTKTVDVLNTEVEERKVNPLRNRIFESSGAIAHWRNCVMEHLNGSPVVYAIPKLEDTIKQYNLDRLETFAALLYSRALFDDEWTEYNPDVKKFMIDEEEHLRRVPEIYQAIAHFDFEEAVHTSKVMDYTYADEEITVIKLVKDLIECFDGVYNYMEEYNEGTSHQIGRIGVAGWFETYEGKTHPKFYVDFHAVNYHSDDYE